MSKTIGDMDLTCQDEREENRALRFLLGNPDKVVKKDLGMSRVVKLSPKVEKTKEVRVREANGRTNNIYFIYWQN